MEESMPIAELKADGAQIENRKVDLFFLLMVAFVALIALGVWLGDFNETFLNGTTL